MNLLRVALALPLCLTLFATPASAECAWVLWERHAESPSKWSPWSRYYHYETRGECWTKITSLTSVPKEGSVTDRLAWLVGTGIYRQRSNASRTDDGVTVFLGDNASNSVAYLCLPDTVDPREAKRGAR